ncbi:MAG TPA: hypothetical protein VMR86_10745 [Myxococcota bacterium]|nr:hypothetical protein [Myxococcota bacterium]
MRSRRARGAALLGLYCALAATSAHAADPASAALPDEKHYEVSVYAWMPMLAAKVDSSTSSVSEHIAFHDLLSHVSGGLLLHGRGEWGPWSVDLDGIWAKLRGGKQSKTVQLGPGGGISVGAEEKTELDEWLFQATAGYRIFRLGSLFSRRPTDTRHVTGELYGGARYWSVTPKIHLDIGSLSARVGSRKEWVDPMVGLRFGIDLSDTVAMGISGDVGGFNIGNWCSDFAWSQTTMLSWAFSESWTAHAGYRFLDFHRDSGDSNVRVQERGPFLALTYRF